MVFEVLNCGWLRHQALNALSRLRTAGEECIPIYNAFSIVSTSRHQNMRRKMASSPATSSTTATMIAITATLRDYQACPGITPREAKNASTLTDHLIKQAKGPVCRPIAGTVGRSCTCCLYNLHGISVCSALLDGAVQTVVPNPLQLHLL